MGLRETVEADRTHQGGQCPVAVLIGGGVPNGSDESCPPLEPDDREFLAESVAPSSGAVLSRVRRALVASGYKIGNTALQTHRRQACACGQ